MKVFICDYQEGAHPKILQKLIETNMEQTHGYGTDAHCENAKKLIKKACNAENADVHFLVGGTQANTIIINSALRPYQGVVSAHTGHINVHETGAIEATGHKVMALKGTDGKLCAQQIYDVYNEHINDETHEHTVMPKMVYISFPTELGTIYSKSELSAISKACKECGFYLFVDGARMGYGLQSPENDLTLSDFAQLSDVFYIGATKVGALFGEAVVIINDDLKKDFRYLIKQHGGMLAKGRLLGIQFETLFEDNLYFDIAQNAIDKAMKLKAVFADAGYEFYADSPTNQQFPILPNNVYEALKDRCELKEKIDDKHTAARFCTSWATEDEAIEEVKKILEGF